MTSGAPRDAIALRLSPVRRLRLRTTTSRLNPQTKTKEDTRTPKELLDFIRTEGT